MKKAKEHLNNNGFSLKARFTVDVELFGTGEGSEWQKKWSQRRDEYDLSISFLEVIRSIEEEAYRNSGWRVGVSLTGTEIDHGNSGSTCHLALRRFQYLLDHLGKELEEICEAMTDEGVLTNHFSIHVDLASKQRREFIIEKVNEYKSRLRKRMVHLAGRAKDRDRITFPNEKQTFVGRCFNTLNEMKLNNIKLTFSEFASLMYPPGGPVKAPERILGKQFKHFGFTWSQLKASFEGNLDWNLTTFEEEEMLIAKIFGLCPP